jgi:NAD(P)-dependent dehydrogenase (short-subunit alcohol dehydrogenase family)
MREVARAAITTFGKACFVFFYYIRHCKKHFTDANYHTRIQKKRHTFPRPFARVECSCLILLATHFHALTADYLLHTQVNILVNNGGVSQRCLARESMLQLDKRLMMTNFTSHIALARALLPHMQGDYINAHAVLTLSFEIVYIWLADMCRRLITYSTGMYTSTCMHTRIYFHSDQNMYVKVFIFIVIRLSSIFNILHATCI